MEMHRFLRILSAWQASSNASRRERAYQPAGAPAGGFAGPLRLQDACGLTVPASIAYNACMQKPAKRRTKQYTIRQVPAELDRRLRKLARQQGKSLNAFVVECLARQADLSPEPVRYHDLDHLIGKWVHDEEFEAALQDQRRIDEEMWK